MRSGSGGVSGSAGDDEERAAHPLGCSREQQPGRRRAAVHDHHAVLDAGGVEHGERVLRRHARAVCLGGVGAVGAAVAARVEGDDAEVAGQVGDLRLPEARVDDRPRREQQQRLLALAEDLVGDADAVDLGEPRLGGRERP